MHQTRTVLAILGVALLVPTVANAVTPEELEATVKRLEQRLAAQDKKIAALQAQRNERQSKESQREAMLEVLKELNIDLEKRPNDLRLYWEDGIRMDSRDNSIKLKFGGRLMVDWGWIDGSGIEDDLGIDVEDGADVRRARLYVAGTMYKDLEFKLQFDFADGDADLKDAYLKIKKVPWLDTITLGHFKEPFSLEELTSSKYITFMERALPNVFAPGRNIGVMANSTLFSKRMTWAVGMFRDVNDFGDKNVDGGYHLTARLTGLPWYQDGGRKLLHLGAGYSLRHPEDPVRLRQRPEAHFVSQRFTDTDTFDADWLNFFGAEAALVYGPWSLQAEYIGVSVDSSPATADPCFSGFYVQGSYFLTGEHRPYKTSSGTFSRVKPKENFRHNGGWGAWEVAARYSYLDLDTKDMPDTARTMQDVTIGLNWYLNPNVRLMWNYIRSCVDGADTSNAADIFMMRLQFDF